jgi:hypothetical protein
MMLEDDEVPTIMQLLQCTTLPSAASYSAAATGQPSHTPTPASNRPGLFVQQELELKTFDLHPGLHLLGVAIQVKGLKGELAAAQAARTQHQEAGNVQAAEDQDVLVAKLQKQIQRRREHAANQQEAKQKRELTDAAITTQQSQPAGSNPMTGTDSVMADSQLLFLAQIPLVELCWWLSELSNRGRSVGSSQVDFSTAGTFFHEGGVSDARAALLVQQLLVPSSGLQQLRNLLAAGVSAAEQPSQQLRAEPAAEGVSAAEQPSS